MKGSNQMGVFFYKIDLTLISPHTKKLSTTIKVNIVKVSRATFKKMINSITAKSCKNTNKVVGKQLLCYYFFYGNGETL